MASPCSAAAATTSFADLIVKSPGAIVAKSSNSSCRASSSLLKFNLAASTSLQLHVNLVASTDTIVKCFPSSSGGRNSNADLSDVRRRRRRGSLAPQPQQEGFRICPTNPTASISRPQRLRRSRVSSSPSSHFVDNRQIWCSLGSGLGLENGVIRQTRNVLWGRRQQQKQRQRRPRAKDDDFEMDDDGGFDAMDLALDDEDEEEDFRDYETEYEAPSTGDGSRALQRGESDTFINTERELEETVVAWKINEDEFHKINMLTCDFFIRKVPDLDGDVYDFREMYVTPPDTDIYSIPKVDGNLPKKPVRCTLSNYEVIHTTEPPVDEPRSPLARTDYEVMKVFLTKHYKDRRAGNENFILDFEEIYVIDSISKSFYRADVQVDVPGGQNRDRSQEVLIVRDGGTSFRIILEEDETTPDGVVQAVHWEKTREAMENYLRGFRDYEISNWF